MIHLATTRRLVEHQFESNGHVYRVPGEFVLSTSDVIELNGLSDVSMIPGDALDYASHRGTALHKAVEAFESSQRPEVAILDYCDLKGLRNRDVFLNEVMERLWMYRTWRAGRTIKLAGKMEVPRVYRHTGTEYLIGATLDMVAFIDGRLTIVDLKTAHKQYGQKAQMEQMKWKLQSQSYVEALEADENFWAKVKPQQVHRLILHLHPECGKNGTKGAQTGFEPHEFTDNEEDAFLWDSAVRMAFAKIKHGYKLVNRRTDLKAQLRASLECEEAPIF